MTEPISSVGPHSLDTLSRRQALKLAGAAVVTAAVGAASGRETAAQAAKPLIVGRNIDDVITLDPGIAGEETYTVVLRGCYDTLVTTPADSTKQIVPMLAESWQVSDDLMTFTFKLKPDVKFNSGNPLSADDVKFSFDRLKNLVSQASYLMDPVKSVEVIDPATVRITLNNPDATFLGSLCSANFSVLDRKVVVDHGGTDQPGAGKGTDGATDWLTQNSAGSGPYVLTGYTPKDRITMTRNAASWRSAGIDDVILQSAPDSSALQQILEKGDAEIAWGLLTEQLNALKQNPDIETASTPMLGFMAVGFTCDPARNKAIADPKVQLALKYAVDYDGIRSLRDGAITPPSIIPVGLNGALEPGKEGYTHDADKARALLAEAGYGTGFKTMMSASSTEIIGGVQDSLLAEKLQSDFGEVGVEVELDVQDEAIFRPKYRAGEIETVIGAYYVGTPTPYDLIDAWGPTGAVCVNRFKWDAPNHPATALFAEARKTADAEKQAALLQQAQRELLKDCPFQVLIQPVFSYPYRNDLTGVVANPTWNFDVATITRKG
jgi:peptide/nickel transport system substrate-binding protein